MIQTKPIAERITPLVQNKPVREEEEAFEAHEEPIIMKFPLNRTQQVNDSLPARSYPNGRGGHPIPDIDRHFMEIRFGVDFSAIRLHAGSNAVYLNRELNARAFTHGRDIYFGAGSYSPGTLSGKRLLAHELTHVIQQERASKGTQRAVPPFVQMDQAGRAAPSGVTMRTFPGCSDDQNFFVELAQTRAPNWVSSTISGLEEYLSEPQTIVTATENTLNRFFHPPSGARGRIGGRHRPETVRRIIHHLRRMWRVLENPRQFRCVSLARCRRLFGADTYAYAGPTTIISICPNFFTLSLTDQIGTLVHESAHRIGLMRNVISRDQVAALPLYRAMTNAESYSLLVIENMLGPPSPAPPSPPTPLTEAWSPAYMSSEVLFTSPVRGLFYEGAGRRRLLSSIQRVFEAPFPSTQPIGFSGQVRFYVDTAETVLPQGTSLPVVSTQVLFTESGTGSVTELHIHDGVNPREYLGPGLPLRIPFSPDFDFTLTTNGRVRFNFWMWDAGSSGDMYALYDDTVTVRPDNDI